MKIELSRYTQNQLVKYSPSGNQGYRNGFDNLFPNYLDGLYNASVTHAGIINDLASYIVGIGLVSETNQEKLDHFFSKRKVEKIIKLDLIQAAKTLEVIKTGAFEVSEINVLLPKQIRVSRIEEGDPVEFIFRQDWNNANYGHRFQEKLIAHTQGIQETKSLFYAYDSGTFNVPYGRPPYMSGLNAIEMEAGIYLMHNHGVQNGMFPSMIIDRETSGSGGEDDTSTADIVSSAAGAAAAGKIIDIKRPQGAQPATFTVPNLTGLDKIYNAQYETSEAGISKAHGLPSSTLIAGLNIKPTGFGDAEEEMQWAMNQWRNKKILPYRKDFLEDLKPLFDELEIYDVRFEDEVNENQEMSYSYDSNTLKTPTTNSVITNITGRQMQAIERLVRKYKKGDLNFNQASLMLKQGYGFNDEEIKVWLNDLENFKSVMSQNDDLQKLIDLGETIEDFEDYEIASIEEAGSKEDEKAYNDITKFVSTGRATPNTKSSQDGNNSKSQYKIRYRYSGDRTGERAFCNRMLGAAKYYRYEDIVNMSFSNVNPGFGISGASNYDIFSYKGGPNCKHKWERVTFVKKGLEGSIDVNSGVAQDNSISASQADARGFTPTGTAKSKDSISQTRPFDMPKRGYFSSIITKLEKWL